jgi:hypothetical protein
MRRLIIGFGNKARQGKDLAVQAVMDYYANKRVQFTKHGLKPVVNVQRVGFADALYEVCRTEYDMMAKDAPLLQRVGAERRALDPEYWIKKAFERIKPNINIVLISDLRYLNEAWYIRDQGGYTVNVTRLNQDGSRYIAKDRPADHPSEIELDGYNWNFRLVNQEGHQALLGEMSITLVEYLRSLS